MAGIKNSPADIENEVDKIKSPADNADGADEIQKPQRTQRQTQSFTKRFSKEKKRLLYFSLHSFSLFHS